MEPSTITASDAVAARTRPDDRAPAPLRSGAAVTVVHVTTVPISLRGHLAGQLSYLARRGFALHVVSSPGPALGAFGAREAVPVHAIPMERAITPLRDLVAVYRLWSLLRRIRPRIVHSHTPKGGLVGMIAATLAGTPVRVYHVRGLPFVTASGPRRTLLRATEWTACRLAHRVLAVSRSMREIAVEEGICPAGKIAVPASGSGNGVDAEVRFRPQGPAVRRATRARYGIPDSALVVGFVGRLARDKGVVELASAWRRLREAHPALHLLLVGWWEADRRLAGEVAPLHGDPRVHFTGAEFETPPLYAAMDVLALPTYREGFPIVALEAAAMSLPIVATSVPGCVDAVVDGVTGTLVPARDADALAAAVARYATDPELRRRHGAAARDRVREEFRPQRIWEAIGEEYRRLLGADAPPRP